MARSRSVLFLVQITRRRRFSIRSGIHLGHERDRAVHRRGQRLRAAHPAEARRHDQAARRDRRRNRLGRGCERLERSLDDALAADVDPRARRHLAVHGQAEALEAAELVARRPGRNEHRVRDQDARGLLVRLEHADRLARLNQHRLVAPQALQRRDDRVERLPVARGPPGAAVDDQLVRLFRHVRDRGCSRASGARLPAASRGSGARVPRAARTVREGARHGSALMARDIWARRFLPGLPAGLYGRPAILPARPPALERNRPRRLEIRVAAPGRRSQARTLRRKSAAHALDRARGGRGAAGTPSPETPRELDCEHPLQVLDDRRELSRRDRRHRDVVLLGRGRRDRVDGGGVREHLALRHERGGRDLRHHEPGVHAPFRDEERRQVRERRVDELLDPALRDRREVRGRDRRVVEDEPDRRAVEVASRDDVALPREDERIVGRAVHLALEHLAGVGEGVARRAVDLGHAAQRVVVLHPAAAAMRLPDRAPVRSARAGWPRAPPLPGAAAPRRSRLSNAASEPREASSDAAPTRSADVARARSRGSSARPPTATDIWTPLIEREPFLGPESDRPDAARPATHPSAARLPAPDRRTRPSPIRPRARCASGARSPDAPTEPCAGTSGRTSAASIASERLDRRDANAGVPAREGVGPQRHHRAHRRGPAARTPDARGVASDQVALERFDLLPRDRDVGELAEARRHAVDRLPRADRAVDDAARGGHRPAGFGRQRRREPAALRHGHEVVQGQAFAGEPS